MQSMSGFNDKLNKYSIHGKVSLTTKREYILFFILFLIPFASMMYGDMKAFTHYEVNFWGSIFEGGGLKNFYEYGAYQDLVTWITEKELGT